MRIKNILKTCYKSSILRIAILLIIIKSFIFDISIVPTGSMFPNIVPWAVLFSTKYDYGYNGYSISPIGVGYPKKQYFSKKIKQGDVVIFKMYPTQLYSIVKRVVGLPGQKIQVIQGNLFIDDIMVEKRFNKYVTNTDNSQCIQYTEILPNKKEYKITEYENGFEWQNNTEPFYIPKDHYFVLGDCRHRSKDSRIIGFIHKEQIIAKLRYVIFSSKNVFGLKHLSQIFYKM